MDENNHASHRIEEEILTEFEGAERDVARHLLSLRRATPPTLGKRIVAGIALEGQTGPLGEESEPSNPVPMVPRSTSPLASQALRLAAILLLALGVWALFRVALVPASRTAEEGEPGGILAPATNEPTTTIPITPDNWTTPPATPRNVGGYPAPPSDVVKEFSVSSTEVQQGEITAVYWETAQAGATLFVNGIPQELPQAKGQLTFILRETTTFVLRAEGQYELALTVTVVSPTPIPPPSPTPAPTGTP